MALARSPSRLSAGDLCRLASDFTQEHGPAASDYAYRAVMRHEAQGEGERAYFWFLLLVLIGDILQHRIDPGAHPSLH
jgi:hypothetical protein